MTSISTPADTAATFCATLADEWIRCGLRVAVIAPGSRSTPLAVALAARPELRVEVFHDERAAAFAGLGVGLATGVPAVVLCTSGTAAAHFHAAVIEAHQSNVPLILCTADRPPELREVGAPQTINQTKLFGGAVRWFVEPGVPDEAQRGTWRSLASRAALDATGPWPGPVHLNLAFREPLVGGPGELPPFRSGGWHTAPRTISGLAERSVDELSALLDSPRGIIVAGRGCGDSGAVHAFAQAAGWPVLADARSGCRVPAPTTIAAFDALLRHDRFADDHRPSVVVRLGEPPASKVLSQWIAASGATEVQISAQPNWIDPDHATAVRVVADPASVLRRLRIRGAAGAPWLASWNHAERTAQKSLGAAIFDDRAGLINEPGIARTVVDSLADGASLVVSSSMPVRDIEWYGAPRTGVTIVANRGANGIDGVISTAIGVAAGTDRKTVVLIGDVAVLHDSSALTALARRAVDLTVVIVDNDGGGIFSFLPQRTQLTEDRFEQLFGTSHGTDLVALCAAHGLNTQVAAQYEDIRSAIRAIGPNVVVARTVRSTNVAVHDRIHHAVGAALSSGGAD